MFDPVWSKLSWQGFSKGDEGAGERDEGVVDVGSVVTADASP